MFYLTILVIILSYYLFISPIKEGWGTSPGTFVQLASNRPQYYLNGFPINNSYGYSYPYSFGYNFPMYGYGIPRYIQRYPYTPSSYRLFNWW